MILHSIRFKNLLQVGNDWAKFNLDSKPMQLIIGKNGTGKSTILDAICFVLYGKPFRKINKPQLVNSINRKNCVVDIAFSNAGHKYMVRRGIKPSIFEIYKDGVIIDQSSAAVDYQEVLEKEIIGCNFKTFCQVNILGSASYVAFMKLPAAHRREVVEDLLDSQVYSTMLVLAKSEYKQLQVQISESLTQLQIARNQVDSQVKLIDRFSQDFSSISSQINQSIDKANQELVKLTDNHFVLKNKYDNLVEQLSALAKDPQKVQSFLNATNQKIQISQMLMQSAKKESDQIINGENCTVCKQVITAEHKHHISELFEQKIQQIEIDQVDQNNRLEKIQSLWDQIVQVTDAANLVNSEIKTNQRLIDQVSQNLNHLQSQLSNIPVDVSVEKDQADLQVMQADLQKATDLYDQYNREAQILKNCMTHLADDGIKAVIVNKYIPRINQMINDNLEKLDTFIQFELDEQFNETIKSRYRDVFTYDSFSEGQKLRIDLAILFTWREIAKQRNSVSSNILVMDEILDRSLDDDGVEQFLHMLGKIANTQNTIIISHKNAVVDQFTDIIIAETKSNFTEYRVLDGTET